MKSVIQKRIIPGEKITRREIRSGHNICCLCSFLVELSSYKVCSLLEWCFITSIEVSSDHSQLRWMPFARSPTGESN